jgi:hypothetical protein
VDEEEARVEEAIALDIGLFGVVIFIIIVCCTSFKLAFNKTNCPSRCGNIATEVNLGQPVIFNSERQGNEGSRRCSVRDVTAII